MITKTNTLDLAYIYNISDHDREFIKEMLCTFLKITPTALDGIKKAYASQNLKEVARLAHRIKPTLMLIGNSDLSKKIKDSDFDFIFAERYGKDAGSLDDTMLTFIGNRIFTYLGKIFFNLKINDILHTFFICKNLSFKKISFNHFNFGFCVELPILVHKYNLKYGSLPTTERKRIAGEVKVKSFKDGIKILKSMIILFFTTFGKKY